MHSLHNVQMCRKKPSDGMYSTMLTVAFSGCWNYRGALGILPSNIMLPTHPTTPPLCLYP